MSGDDYEKTAIPKAEALSPKPSILTSTVGSYPWPEWLANSGTETALVDATRVVFDIQRQSGIDLPTDGELYRFDPSHSETNGMIEYFVRPLGGIRSKLGRSETERFLTRNEMSFRSKPAAIVENKLSEGSLDLLSDCIRTARVAGGPFKFTMTSPYMLARTLLDEFYLDFEELLMALAEVLGKQVPGLPASCLQIDEANITGNPQDAPLAARAINKVLDHVDPGTEKAVHFCFGNYGGQTIQKGTWKTLIDFLNSLHTDHLVLELAHRGSDDLYALKDVDEHIKLGIGVVDVKINHIESAEEIASGIEQAEKILGPDRIKYIHPDCGFWMLKRSVADQKIATLKAGRDLYLGLSDHQ